MQADMAQRENDPVEVQLHLVVFDGHKLHDGLQVVFQGTVKRLSSDALRHQPRES